MVSVQVECAACEANRKLLHEVNVLLERVLNLVITFCVLLIVQLKWHTKYGNYIDLVILYALLLIVQLK